MKDAKSFVVVALIILCAVSTTAQERRNNWLRIEVTNAEGEPLSRACVTVVPHDEGEIVFRQCNRDGRVTFKGLAAGSYRVVVKVNGYEAQKREVIINEGAETIVFSLQPHKL